jgi:hypothetical protein
MQVQVEHRTGDLGVEMPVRFRFDGREVEIVENVDQWYGPDYCYFKIKGNDGNLSILRFDEGRPLPASLAAGAGARPDHPITGHQHARSQQLPLVLKSGDI